MLYFKRNIKIKTSIVYIENEIYSKEVNITFDLLPVTHLYLIFKSIRCIPYNM